MEFEELKDAYRKQKAPSGLHHALAAGFQQKNPQGSWDSYWPVFAGIALVVLVTVTAFLNLGESARQPTANLLALTHLTALERPASPSTAHLSVPERPTTVLPIFPTVPAYMKESVRLKQISVP